ncbi:lipoyl(octanoyl) transferase LipB [Corynebacterium striatum]|uniref:lipoyl(octanoyl) transferase LipB n=1 Tax=Corynebacterium striatum TaxID=43770 RepID=UPI0006687264|nr:lipoyl(octanoyl) transferase LipB [Corynebacterium striatum]EGT5592189.1 lipoyl(octanoyl) transferase LipB [Corynebacterium striatum]KAA1265870.1 lipoyl(octanoyl) transferase LipB [Corynebacterium striatum]MDK8832316.1 lipoyl(octanoyl) transferase LipB [Corynebacterium striatum]MDK8876206.1 lipoyl(octanoyl) transferase LipB [Corynebacterium striatum]QRP17750.1 lipoyl(octanoyl) transferase LipB [Corynebacterium striatum]
MTAPREPFFPADRSIRASEEPLEIRHLGRMDYQEAWDLQADLAAKRAAGEHGDVILVAEHPNIYTAGKRTQPEDMPDNGLPVITVDRGGRITWHGEGQLVIYPILKLAEPVDVVDYVRRLEEAIIQAVRELGVVTAGRVDGRSGVWVPSTTRAADPQAPTRDRKIAALGIRITRGVTMHGLALNCTNTLEYYDHIVACGIDDADVTTLSLELGREVTVEEASAPLLDALERALSGELTVADHSFASAPDPIKVANEKARQKRLAQAQQSGANKPE